jgi:hypothetical protein
LRLTWIISVFLCISPVFVSIAIEIMVMDQA